MSGPAWDELAGRNSSGPAGVALVRRSTAPLSGHSLDALPASFQGLSLRLATGSGPACPHRAGSTGATLQRRHLPIRLGTRNGLAPRGWHLAVPNCTSFKTPIGPHLTVSHSENEQFS